MTKSNTDGISIFGRAALAALFLLLTATAFASADEKTKIMVFDTEFVDLMVSGTGESFTTAEDISRAKSISDAFREAMAEKYKVITPAEDSPPYDLSCPDCILDIAKNQGADLVLTSALSRANSMIVYLKYELGDVAKDKRLVSGNIELNGFTQYQLDFAAANAIDHLMKGGTTEQGAAVQ